MRQRLAQFFLFLIPLSLLLGERQLFKIRDVPFYAFELLTAFLFFLLLPELRVQARKSLKKVPRAYWVGLSLLVVGLVLSTSAAASTHDALGAVKSWFLVPIVLGLIITASNIEVKPLVWGIITHALVQVVYGLSLLNIQTEQRLLGTFSSPNFLAAILVPAALIAVASHIKGRWIIAGILVGGLFLTQSLGGFLGLLGGGAYLIWKGLGSPKARKVAVTGLLICLSVGVSIAYGRFAHSEKTSLQSRQEIWTVAMRIGQEHPVTGIGLRNFRAAYLQEVNKVYAAPIEYEVPEPHNLLLAFWLDLSLIGLVAMLVIMTVGVLGSAVGAVAVVAIFAHGLVDTPLFKLELAVLFWLYVTLALSWHHSTSSSS